MNHSLDPAALQNCVSTSEQERHRTTMFEPANIISVLRNAPGNINGMADANTDAPICVCLCACVCVYTFVTEYSLDFLESINVASSYLSLSCFGRNVQFGAVI